MWYLIVAMWCVKRCCQQDLRHLYGMTVLFKLLLTSANYSSSCVDKKTSLHARTCLRVHRSMVLVSTYCWSGISSSVSQSESTASGASSLVPSSFIKNGLAIYPSSNCWLPLPCSWQYQSNFRTLHMIVLEFQLHHTSQYNKYTSITSYQIVWCFEGSNP